MWTWLQEIEICDFEKYGCEMKSNFHEGPARKFKGEMVKNLVI